MEPLLASQRGVSFAHERLTKGRLQFTYLRVSRQIHNQEITCQAQVLCLGSKNQSGEPCGHSRETVDASGDCHASSAANALRPPTWQTTQPAATCPHGNHEHAGAPGTRRAACARHGCCCSGQPRGRDGWRGSSGSGGRRIIERERHEPYLWVLGHRVLDDSKGMVREDV